MFKLTVVSGPNRGTSYVMQEGETSIGRQAGNAVVLPSSKVSKKHCTLVVNNGEIVVQDQGSSNGTFVNGILTKARKVKAGDRVSVGEYVLEIVEPPKRRTPRAAPAISGLGNVVQLPGAYAGGGARMPASPAGSMQGIEVGSASATGPA